MKKGQRTLKIQLQMQECLELMSIRLPQREIASRMKISIATVERLVRIVKEESQGYYSELVNERFGHIFRMNMEGFERIIRQFWINYDLVEDPLKRCKLLPIINKVTLNYTLALQDGPMVVIVQDMLKDLKEGRFGYHNR